MGNSMEETLGIVTAITEQTRNSTKAARGANSIFANLAQVLDDSSSNGKKITEIFKELGVEMYENGQLKSGYDLLSGMAEKWGTLDGNTQKYIATTLAGTNQLNNFLALMNNFDHAISATETALNSAGSADRENERYMESLNAKTNQLKATFEDLANNTIDSELVKSILDLSNKALEKLNTETGQTITQWALLAGTLTGALTIFGTISSKLVGSITVVGKLITGTSSLASIFGTASMAGGGLLASLSSILSVAAPVAGVLAAIGAGGYAIYKAYKEANPTLEEATEKIGDLNSQLESNKQRIKEIDSLGWAEKTSEILEEKEALEKENSELEENIALLEKRKIEAAKDISGRTVDVYMGEKYTSKYATTGTTNQTPQQFNSYEEALQALIDKYGETVVEEQKLADSITTVGKYAESTGAILDTNYKNILNDLTEELKSNNNLSDESIVIRDKNIQEIQKQVQAYELLKNTENGVTVSQQNVIDAYYEYIDAADIAEEHTKWLGENLAVNEGNLQSLRKEYPLLSSAISENNGVVGVNVEQLFSQANQSVETRKELAKLVAEMTVFNQTGLSGSQIITTLLQIAEAAGVAADSMIYARQAAAGDNRAAEYMRKEYGNVQNWFNSLVDQITVTTPTGFTGNSGGSKSSVKKLTDTALNNFNLYYKDLQHLRDMDLIDEEEYLNRLRVLVDNYTSDATSNMKKYGTDAKTISRNMYQYEEELVNGWKNLQEEKVEAAKQAQQEIVNQLEKEKSSYEKFFSYMVNKIDKQISDLQKERDKEEEYWDSKIDALQSQNDEIERQIELEKIQQNLASVNQQQLLVYKDGRFQYVKNVQEISEAEKELEAYEREEALRQETENLEELKNKALESIDEQIRYWGKYKEEWESVVDKYQEEQDVLILEQELGIELEGNLWKERLDNLQSYADQYKSILQQIANAQASINNAGTTSGGGNGNGGYHFDWDKNPGGGWTKEEMEEGFFRGSGGGGGSSRDDDDDGGWSDTSWTNRGDSVDKVKDAYEKSKETGGRVDLGGGIYIDANKVSKHARGTMSARGGLSLVGEEGPELRVINSGDGIISNGLTKNLISMARQYDAKKFALNKETIESNEYQYNFDKIVLPNVTDFNSFVKEIKRFRRFAFQQ